MHIQNGPGKTDEGNSTCGALFPAVTIAFGIQLARSLSLSLSISVALSLSLSVILWQISFEECNMLQVLFSDNLSDNLAITICCTRFSGKDFNNFRKEIKGHECKMKGKCVQMKGR